MGKHFWMKHVDDKSHNQQPGCMWGLVHMLGYHHRHSNVRKMIKHQKYDGQTHPECDSSPQTKIHHYDAYEEEKLLDAIESTPHPSPKRSCATKKRSLKARIKAFITEDTSKESKNARGSNLQRTYSIHHLKSLDDDQIYKKWKHPIVVLPRNAEHCAAHSLDHTSHQDAAKQGPDVLEIFKVDRELLIKHLTNADEGIANFTRSALGLNKKVKFGKSRSFPVAESSQTRKLKPVKLENKQKEVWSVPREDKFQTISREDRVIKKAKQSSSLNESVDKYARLFENGFRMDPKLNASKSLKLANEFEVAPLYFRRKHSLSNVDSYCFNPNLEVFLGDDISAKGGCPGLQKSEQEKIINGGENMPLNADTTAKCHNEPVDRCNTSMEILESGATLVRLFTSNDECEKSDGLEEEAEKLKKSDSLLELEVNCLDIARKELLNHGLLLDTDIFLDKTEPRAVELQISEGLEPGSRVHESNSQIISSDPKSVPISSLSTHNILELENDETSDRIIKHFGHDKRCPEENNSDMNYVKCLLYQSGIAVDTYEMSWDASDQPLGPQVFEEVEASWPHDQDELNGYPDFWGCWHHRMLYDLVDEVLTDMYDVSLPYYPKALSSNCHVRPFTSGDRVVDEVSTNIGMLVNLKPEEKQSLEGIVAHDLVRDRRWMNLQFDAECVALELEDVIFSELLEEVIFS